MSQYDIPSVHDFLMHTPEQGLRKMLVDGKSFTDVHFQMMIKTVRACGVEDFCKHYDAKDYPKIKYTPNEVKLKEKFWGELENTLKSRGLLNPAMPQKNVA